MRKFITAAAVLLAGSMMACGSAAPATEAAKAAETKAAETTAAETTAAETAAVEAPEIVVTIFPEYDWVMNILGDNPAGAEVTLLLDDGVDLHSYQPTVDDILTVGSSDLFLYVGGESDGWVEDILAEAVNPDIQAVNLLEALGDRVKEEEIVEGMEHDHGHEHGEEHEHEYEEEHGHEEEHDHDHEHGEAEYDEHVWLSLKNAGFLCGVIAEKLAGIDPDHADAYLANADAYKAKLDALDAGYGEAVSAAARKTVLFGDRFPFRYMVDDYGLEYYAAFAGCSAESEASFETVLFLSQKVDELSLPAILTIETGDKRLAEMISRNTASKNQEILTMDSLQSTTGRDIADGATYLGAMEKNLEVLKKALR